jgi:hypothetical protein
MKALAVQMNAYVLLDSINVAAAAATAAIHAGPYATPTCTWTSSATPARHVGKECRATADL